MPAFSRGRDETSTPSIPPSDSSCCRAPSGLRFAGAQSYPTRAVHLIEGFGAGGAPDIVAQLIGQSLSEQLRAVIHCREPK
jgi:tripartite-type tricarboxylate transporter receptor subunit TctC